DTLEALKQSPALRDLYNNLKQHDAKPEEVSEERTDYIVLDDPVLHLALQIDATVKQVRPDDWRGVEPRERVIKQALFSILQDVAEVGASSSSSERRRYIDGHADRTR